MKREVSSEIFEFMQNFAENASQFIVYMHLITSDETNHATGIFVSNFGEIKRHLDKTKKEYLKIINFFKNKNKLSYSIKNNLIIIKIFDYKYLTGLQTYTEEELKAAGER